MHMWWMRVLTSSHSSGVYNGGGGCPVWEYKQTLCLAAQECHSGVMGSKSAACLSGCACVLLYCRNPEWLTGVVDLETCIKCGVVYTVACGVSASGARAGMLLFDVLLPAHSALLLYQVFVEIPEALTRVTKTQLAFTDHITSYYRWLCSLYCPPPPRHMLEVGNKAPKPSVCQVNTFVQWYPCSAHCRSLNVLRIRKCTDYFQHTHA